MKSDKRVFIKVLNCQKITCNSSLAANFTMKTIKLVALKVVSNKSFENKLKTLTE